MASPFIVKSGLIGEVASLDGDSLLVFYYLSASEIWSDEEVVFSGRGGLMRGGQRYNNKSTLYYW